MTETAPETTPETDPNPVPTVQPGQVLPEVEMPKVADANAEPEADPADLYDPRVDQPELTVPDEQAAADYATAVKAIVYPERYDVADLHLDGVDFVGSDPEPSAADPFFSAGN